MARTRIGIIGSGGMARSHVARFEQVLDRIEVVAAVDIERDKARAVADLIYGEVLVETDYRQIFEYIDAALVVLPHHLHSPVTVDCLRAGKHVL